MRKLAIVSLWLGVSLIAAADCPSYLTKEAKEEWRNFSESDVHSAGVQESSQPTATNNAGAVEVRGGSTGRTVAEALETDGETASNLIPMIFSLKPSIDPALAYDIAHNTARWGRNNDVDPKLLIAVMVKESGFNPNAKSPTNDHGLMQLHGRRIYGVRENIRQGAAHLGGCLKTSRGNARSSLAHYNGGSRPPRVSYAYADRVLKVAGANYTF